MRLCSNKNQNFKMSCLNDDLADGFLPSLKIHKIHGGLNIKILQLKRKILYKKII